MPYGADAFAAELSARLQRSAEPGSELAALRVGDLFLARACVAGLPEAHRAFDASVLVRGRDVIARIDPSSAFVDEVLQKTRERLLLADGGPPRIDQYSGKGSLLNWVRAVALRVALNLRRPASAEVELDAEAVLERPASGADIEFSFIRREYRQAFRQSFEDATRELPPRDRNVLRLHFVDGLNIDQLGTLYGAHRSTVARWIASSRDFLLARTRRLLEERLRLSQAELDELVGTILSNVELSLSRILQDEG